MLLGFISLLLTATSTDAKEREAENAGKERRLLMVSVSHKSFRRLSEVLNQNTCKEGYEPFVSYEGLEQLHRFIFVMAVTHISYSCLTMLLAIVKVLIIREKLAELYESEEQWSRATQMLSGIDLDSAIRLLCGERILQSIVLDRVLNYCCVLLLLLRAVAVATCCCCVLLLPIGCKLVVANCKLLQVSGMICVEIEGYAVSCNVEEGLGSSWVCFLGHWIVL